jgi:hypothetical protein
MRMLSLFLSLCFAALPVGATRIITPKIKSPAPAVSARTDLTRQLTTFSFPQLTTLDHANSTLVEPVRNWETPLLNTSLKSPQLAPVLAAQAEQPAPQETVTTTENKAATVEATWEQWSRLESARENNAFAKRHNIHIAMTEFDRAKLLGLEPENLAQLEPESGKMFFNWNMVGPDMLDLKRRSGNYALTGMALAPVASHEAGHARLRKEFGGFVPPTREEELLTHAYQAQAFAEIVRREGPGFANLDSFLIGHNRALWERWQDGWQSFMQYVLRKNAGLPAINDGNDANIKRALNSLDDINRHPEDFPTVWRTRWQQALAFWQDDAKTTRLIEMLRPQIETAAADAQRDKR